MIPIRELCDRLRNIADSEMDEYGETPDGTAVAEAAELIIAQGVRIGELERDVRRYWPYVEAVATQRYPFKADDEIEAYEMLRERRRAGRWAKP